MKTAVEHADRGQQPPIYCFVAGKRRRIGHVVVAMSQAGVIIASEIAKSEDEARVLIGLGSLRNHDIYQHHHPNGYILMWVPEGFRNEEVRRVIGVNLDLQSIIDDAWQRMEEE